MGFVGSLFGGNSGASFQAAPIEKYVTKDQTNTAYNNALYGISQQNAFLQALQGQGGIQNQSNVFNQQQALANQLQGIAAGTDPNPALAQLNQATGQNVANQAALMAGQRGTGANAGLLARQAAQQGGALQQQAVGQGATLRAQQQLAGIQALQQQQGMMGNLATQQVGQQAGAIAGSNKFAQGEQSNLLNAINQQNQAQNQQSQINAGMAQTQAKGQFGLLNAAGGALGLFADGGMVGPNDDFYHFGSSKAQSKVGGLLSKPLIDVGGALKSGVSAIGHGIGSLFTPTEVSGGGVGGEAMAPQMMAAHGGYVDAMVSPGERYLPPKEVEKVKDGKKHPLKAGEKIPGKAKVKGDSLKNDVVPKKLKEGGIVLPRSVTEHPNAPQEAAKFVQAILAKQGLKR